MEHLKLSEQGKRTIVAAGKHVYVLDKIQVVLSDMGFTVLVATEREEIYRLFKTSELDGFFIAGGIDPLIRSELVDFLLANMPGVKIIDHFGGPANIKEEVELAFRL